MLDRWEVMSEKEDADNFYATQPLSLIPRDYLHVRADTISGNDVIRVNE